MAVKIRLSRGGSKKRPHYSIVAADERAPRDGRFLEKLGTYNPMLPKDHDGRFVINAERVQHWLSVGAKPTDRVARFLEKLDMSPAQNRNNPKKAVVGKKMADRAEAKAAKITEAQEAAAALEAESSQSQEDAPQEEAKSDTASE